MGEVYRARDTRLERTVAAPLTSEGMVVRTFQYMSPEQIEGRALDHRTDIFSLGVLRAE